MFLWTCCVSVVSSEVLGEVVAMARVGRMVKESIVREISEALSKRPNFLVTGINRLPASGADTLRQKLFASRAHLLVIKQRLGLRAIEPLKISGLAELLEGSVGLVLVDGDVLPVAKLVVEFRKAHEDELSVKGAVVDGQLLDARNVEELAGLPARPVLLAQVVATIEAPIAEVILTIEQLMQELAWVAEQAAAKKPATEAGTAAVPPPSASGLPSPAPAIAGGPGSVEGGGTATPPSVQEATPSQPEAGGGETPTAPPTTS